MPERFVYRLHVGRQEHQVIDSHDGSVHRRIDDDPRYPANGGMMMRFTARLNEESNDAPLQPR